MKALKKQLPVMSMRSDRKNRLLFYSDCPFFAGCENMLVSLLSHPEMSHDFKMTFAYRKSELYEEGLQKRLKADVYKEPITLLPFILDFEGVLRNRFIRFKKLVKILLNLLGWRYVAFIHTTIKLYHVFRRINPDILHINNGGYPASHSCNAAAVAGRLAGIPAIVYVVNNIAFPYDSFSRLADLPIDALVKRSVTCFITGSEFAGRKLKDLWKLPTTKIKNIPNTIIPRAIHETREQVLDRLGFGDKNIILGTVGVLESRKGHEYLIRGFSLFRGQYENFDDLILIVEGVGQEKKKLHEMARSLELENQICFLENEHNIFDLLNIFDIFILPSIENEDFPNVILEAMSLGKPIIGTNLAGVPEQVAHDQNGYVVSRNDPAAIAESVLDLLNDQQKRFEMGQNSYQRFQELFSWDRVIDRYKAMYHQLLTE